MENEKVLVERILSGEEAAFAELVQKYQNLVYHIILRLVPNPHDQEDLFQEIFLKIYRGLANFRGESKLSTWIGRITFNTCMKFMKRSFREADFNLNEDLTGEIAESNWEKVGEAERSLQLHRAVSELPKTYRLLIELFHFQELSYKEISEITDMPEGTVKNYLFRARKALRQILESEKYREVMS
ncbi:MAG: RNA polymerase sigma factor RpoE [Calditrichia bacterium]